jgi:histidine phosphotransferase ChpT
VPIPASELAARLAARLCHDFANPAGGIQSGLDFLADPDSPIPREEALALVQECARTLSAQLAFARVAFGAGEEIFAAGGLERLARPLFEAIRPSLTWLVEEPELPGAPARVLLNLVQMAGAALASGGEVWAAAGSSEGGWRLSVDAVGSRAKLHPEVQEGLEGRPRSEGLAGRWVQGAFVHAMTASAGGSVSVSADADTVRFTAILPV